MMADEQTQTQDAPPANSETGNAPGTEAQAKSEKSGEKLFTQADLDRQIDDRLKRERAKAEAQAQKVKQEAEERAAIEQGNWQKIAEERKTQLDQLTPKATLADDLTVIVTQQLDAEIAAWPESARAIVSADGLDLKAKLELVNRTRPLAQEILAAQGQRTSGTQFPPQFSGSGGNQQSSNRVLDDFRRQQAEEASKAINPLLRK